MPTPGAFGESHWDWPPLVTDVIEADDKKQARALIESEYNKKLPIKVSKKDRDNTDYLLWLTELKETDYKYNHLLNENVCPICDNKFTILAKYQMNDHSGSTFCSEECKQRNDEERANFSELHRRKEVIYKITNKLNNKCYVGQTCNTVTFRWFQHLYQNNNGNTKFYKELSSVSIENWTFEVIEIVQPGHNIYEREQYWINFYNSIENGYNSATACKKVKDNKDQQMLELA